MNVPNFITVLACSLVAPAHCGSWHAFLSHVPGCGEGAQRPDHDHNSHTCLYDPFFVVSQYLSGLGITGNMDRDGRGGHCLYSYRLRVGNLIYAEAGEELRLF